MKKYVLGSTSPRRRELLKNIIEEFEIISPSYDEKISDKPFSYELIEETAEKKCLSISETIDKKAIIISADTVVIFDGVILGKPKNYDNALEMLTMLNGKTHKVVTSVCIIDTETNKKIVQSETSEVTFENQEHAKLVYYIENFKPFDKAGSYGIQELPAGFIKNIKGDFNNIVGFPTSLVEKMLLEITK